MTKRVRRDGLGRTVVERDYGRAGVHRHVYYGPRCQREAPASVTRLAAGMATAVASLGRAVEGLRGAVRKARGALPTPRVVERAVMTTDGKLVVQRGELRAPEFAPVRPHWRRSASAAGKDDILGELREIERVFADADAGRGAPLSWADRTRLEERRKTLKRELAAIEAEEFHAKT